MKWEDEEGGEFSQVDLFEAPRESLGAAVWPPVAMDGKPRRRNWETSIAVRSEGLAPSLEAAKVEAEAALRRDAERIVTALGGKVVWP